MTAIRCRYKNSWLFCPIIAWILFLQGVNILWSCSENNHSSATVIMFDSLKKNCFWCVVLNEWGSTFLFQNSSQTITKATPNTPNQSQPRELFLHILIDSFSTRYSLLLNGAVIVSKTFSSLFVILSPT